MAITLYGTKLNDNGSAVKFVEFNIPRFTSFSPRGASNTIAPNFVTGCDGSKSNLDVTPINWIEAFMSCFDVPLTGSLASLVGEEIHFFSAPDVSSTKYGFTLTQMYESAFFLGRKQNFIGMAIEHYDGTNRPFYLCQNPETGADSFEGLLTTERTLTQANVEAGGGMRNLISNNITPFLYYTSRNVENNSLYTELNNRENMYNLNSWGNWYTMIFGSFHHGGGQRLKLAAPVRGIEYIEFSAPVVVSNFCAPGQIETTYETLAPYKCTSFLYSCVGTDLTYLFDTVTETAQTIALSNGYISLYRGGVTNGQGEVVSGYIVDLVYDGKAYRAVSTGSYGWFGYKTLENERRVRSYENRGLYLFTPPAYFNSPTNGWSGLVTDGGGTYQYQYPNAPFSFFTEIITYSNEFCRVPQNDYETAYSFNLPVYTTNYRNPNGYSVSSVMQTIASGYATDIDSLNSEWWRGLISGNFPKGEVNPGTGSIGGGSSGTGGGAGGYDDTSDSDTGEGIIPDGGYSNIPPDVGKIDPDFKYEVGEMYTMLYMTEVGIKRLGDALWQEGLLDWVNTKLSAIQPAELVMSVKLVPYFPGVSSENYSLTKLGGYVLDDAITCKLCNAYTFYSFGKVKINEYFGNFLDYNNTKIQLFLPFVGDVDIATSDVMNRTVELRASIDNMAGVVVYQLLDDNANIIGSWNATCAVDIPVTSGDYTGRISGAINAGIQAGTFAATAGGSMAVSGTIKTVEKTNAKGVKSQTRTETNVSKSTPKSADSIMSSAFDVGNAIEARPGSSSKSSYAGVAGVLGQMKPCFRITRPKAPVSEGFQAMNGYPSDVTTSLAAISGYTEVAQVHLENMGNATADEIAEIESLLKSGVIF